MTDEKRRIPIWERPAAASADEAAGRADGSPPPGPDPAAAVSSEGGPGSASASDAAARSPASRARPSWPQTVEGGGTEGEGDVGGTDDADDVSLATEDALEALAAERDMFYDQLLRQRAEFENFRRRTQKELSDAEARARRPSARRVLPILDNLDRALSAAEHHEEGKVLQGVRMTHTCSRTCCAARGSRPSTRWGAVRPRGARSDGLRALRGAGRRRDGDAGAGLRGRRPVAAAGAGGGLGGSGAAARPDMARRGARDQYEVLGSRRTPEPRR